MLTEFQWKVTESEGIFKYDFSGQITAQSAFPIVDPMAHELNILLENVTYMNSGGVRQWMSWMSQVSSKAPKARLVFENVPPVLTRQLVIIKSMIPENSEIKSIYGLFYCEKCDKTCPHLFRYGENFEPSMPREKLRAIFETTNCPSCSLIMEADVDPEHYISLIEKYPFFNGAHPLRHKSAG